MNWFVSINDRDILCEGKIEPQESHGHQEDADIVKVNRFDVVFEMINLTKYHHDDDDTRHPRKDGTHHEVRAEDGAVPHGLNGHGKDKRHDRVNGDHDRDNKNRHGTDRFFEDTVLSLRPCPP